MTESAALDFITNFVADKFTSVVRNGVLTMDGNRISDALVTGKVEVTVAVADFTEWYQSRRGQELTPKKELELYADHVESMLNPTETKDIEPGYFKLGAKTIIVDRRETKFVRVRMFIEGKLHGTDLSIEQSLSLIEASKDDAVAWRRQRNELLGDDAVNHLGPYEQAEHRAWAQEWCERNEVELVPLMNRIAKVRLGGADELASNFMRDSDEKKWEIVTIKVDEESWSEGAPF